MVGQLAVGTEVAAELDVVRAALERRAQRVHARRRMQPDGEMQRLLVRRLGLVRPAARDVEGVPRLQGELVDGRADLAKLG